MKTTITTIALFATAGIATAGIGIQSNGGFELGDGADAQDWAQFATGAAGSVSQRVLGNANSGDYAMEIAAFGNSTTGASSGINQNTASFGLASLAPGSGVQLSFSALTDYGPGGVGFYALRILNADGAIVADTGLQNFGGGQDYQSYTSAELFVPDFGGAPNDYYAAFVEIVVNAGAFDGSFASAFIDDVVISGTVVPAPGALALLGLGGLAAARRRR